MDSAGVSANMSVPMYVLQQAWDLQLQGVPQLLAALPTPAQPAAGSAPLEQLGGNLDVHA